MNIKGKLVEIFDTVQVTETFKKREFIIEDNIAEVSVIYNGILPDLFREGQGVIAEGKFIDNFFIANEIVAKHDENYMPKEVYESLKNK